MHFLLKPLSLSLLAGAGFTFAKPPTGTATVNILASPQPHVAVACLDANALIVPLGECATFTAEPAMQGAAIIQNPDGLPCGFNPDTFECVSGAGTAFELRGQNNVFSIPETGPGTLDSFFFENITTATMELMNATGLVTMLMGWDQITN